MITNKLKTNALEETHNNEILNHTKEIVVASLYKSPSNDIPKLIEDIYSKLVSLQEKPIVEAFKPAIEPVSTITPDYLICLEDGRKLKALKRHLQVRFNLTPDAYREKWGLPKDYPMVAPNYAKKRSMIAKKFKLGKNKLPNFI